MSRADRLVPVEMLGVGSSCTATIGQRIDYSPNDADREWVARELGDVPYDRIVGQSCHDNPSAWAGCLMMGDPLPDYFGETVPVESMGRDDG